MSARRAGTYAGGFAEARCLASQEGSKGGVALCGAVLLDPVRDVGQELESEMANEGVGAVGRVFGEEAVFFAPQEESGDFDDREAEAQLTTETAAANEGAIPVDHGREGTGLRGVLDRRLDEVAREGIGRGGRAEHGLADGAGTIASQETLRQARNLEEADVPGAQELVWATETADEASGMGNVKDDEAM